MGSFVERSCRLTVGLVVMSEVVRARIINYLYMDLSCIMLNPASCGSPGDGAGVRYWMREVVTAWGDLTDHPPSYAILTQRSTLLEYEDDCVANAYVP